MKIYQIGGLGADERVFQSIKLDYEVQTIIWIQPKKKECLESYVKRLLYQIDTQEEYCILGVSFGGLIAIELAKIINPKLIILISSAVIKNQLPTHFITLGKTGILSLMPNALIKPPKFIMHFLFSAINKKLLDEIINDTDPDFIRWALISILNWNNKTIPCKVIRIHGTSDRLFPLKGDAIRIENGGHFMIVDKAKEISKLINLQLKNNIIGL